MVEEEEEVEVEVVEEEKRTDILIILWNNQ